MSAPALAPLLQEAAAAQAADPATPSKRTRPAPAIGSPAWGASSPQSVDRIARWSPTNGVVTGEVETPRRPKGQHWSPTAGILEFDTPVAAAPPSTGGSESPPLGARPRPLVLPAPPVSAAAGHERPLSSWWLCVQGFFFLASSGTIMLVQSVLLPAQIAVAVGDDGSSGSGFTGSKGGGGGDQSWDKNAALGVCSAVGAATQLLQPVVGVAVGETVIVLHPPLPL